ncbi:hypothetical protein G7054_g9675 [Neopestalotiopsis clavispora]|nr:hypothetical protein G7054_g9675 [Neopestalotiopsis clavispora]
MRGKQANSFCEWVVGANYTRRKKSTRRTVASLTVETDDETDTDTISLSIPRGKGRVKTSRTKQEKQVRFSEAAESSEDAKEADTSATSAEPSEAEVSENETTDAAEAETTDEDIDSDCPCGKCVSGRERLKKKQEAESDADTHTKHKDKKDKKAAAKDKSKSKAKDKNSKKKNKAKEKEPESEAEAESGSETAVDSDASEAEEKENTKPKNKKQKGKGGNKKQAEASGEETEAVDDTEEEKPKKGKKKDKNQNDEPKGNQKKKNKGGDAKNKSDEKPQEQEVTESAPSTKKKKKEKKAKAFVQPPPRRPDLLMPVSAHVVQVEHSIESAEDPRPNAFYDVEHGVMRVYHGSAYGNPYGVLYPKRWGQNMPLGTPHPSQNPWFYGFHPSHAPVPPPQVIPATQSADGPRPKNPWYQGEGVVQVINPVTPMPKDSRAIYNESPSLRAAAKKDSNNVVPFAPPGSRAGSNGGRSIQGAPEAKQDETSGNVAEANEQAKVPWSPSHSQQLENDLQQIRAGSKKNSLAGSQKGSKAGSQKNDNGEPTGGEINWNNNDAGVWGADDTGNSWQNNDNTEKVDVPATNVDTNDQPIDHQKEDDWGANNGQNNDNEVKNSPSNKPPSSGGNVMGRGDHPPKEDTPRSRHSNQSMPGTWPQTGSNVFGGSAQGETATNNNNTSNTQDWQDLSAAMNTGGYFDTKEGQAELANTKW